MTTFLTSAPVRVTLRWQVVATAVIALIAGLLSGFHGAVSAALGGAITMIAGTAYALVITVRRAASAESTLVTMFVAEGVKIGAIIVLLWLVITRYADMVSAAFFVAFVITVLLNRVAFLIDAPDAVELDKIKSK